MQKNHIVKIFAIGIIVLLIGVGIYPVFAVNSNKEYIQDENDTNDMKYNNYNSMVKQVIKSKELNDFFGGSVSISGD